jgi:hypothetical protein
LAGAALRAPTELDWPDVTGRIESPEGMVGIVIPGETVRNLVRQTLNAARQPPRS